MLILSLLSAAMVPSAVCRAQEGTEKAEKLMKEYRFEEALDALEKLLPEEGQEADSLFVARVEAAIDRAHNGLSMKNYCCSPVPVAKKKVPKEEFHLYYPVPDGSWVSSPGSFSEEGGFGTLTWFPEGSTQAYFADRTGDGDAVAIFHSESSGKMWTAPSLVDLSLPETAEMLFPVLSPDGLSLYFSSSELYGVGGYDLYVSRRQSLADEWGLPENLGFPFSSPYDDFLYMDTPDGRYSVFASDRECPGSGDVVIYVLEYDSMPLRRCVSEPGALAELCLLKGGSNSGEKEDEAAAPAGAYASLQREYADLKRDMARSRSALETLRHRLSADADNGDLKESIAGGEAELAEKGRRLEELSVRLAKEEMTLLEAGSVPVRRISGQAGGDAGRSAPLQLGRHREAADPGIAFMVRKESLDYRFRMLQAKEGKMVPDTTLPEGLVYRIQLFSRAKGEVKAVELKGLSPVFVENEGGRTSCFAGIFSKYEDAEKALATVRKAGFRSAFVSAYSDGEKINLSEARQLEKEGTSEYAIAIHPSSGKLDERDIALIRKTVTKDMTRELSEGDVVYVLGPYHDVAEAKTEISALEAAGLQGVELKRIK